MVVWLRVRGVAAPTAREWRSSFLLAMLIFLSNYGLVFWAETRIPSGVTAVMQATIPAFIALAEIVVLGLGGHLKTGHTWTAQNRPRSGRSSRV